MDAGVLQLHIFPHQSARQSLTLDLADGIAPSITGASTIVKRAPVSLIIPTFFNDQLKNRSLQHALAGISDSQCIDEIVLVCGDGASDRPGVEIDSKKVVHVQAEPNRRAQTRNLGAASASNELMLFLDDDMLVRDWRAIDALVSTLLEGDFDCALFPRRHYARFPLLYDTLELGKTITQWRSGNEHVDGDRLYDPLRDGCPFLTMAFCFPGCFMLIRRESFEMLGGFPDEFEGWGFEDSDFAIRATAVLQVLNLFRVGEPLLHLDHPVSPYKSEEYQRNFHQFLAAHSLGDVERLCRDVIAGEHFTETTARRADDSAVETPLVRVLECPELPFAGEEEAVREVRQNYAQLLEFRFEKSCEAIPQWIVLHGSRGAGRAVDGSDFDLLFLFRGGHLREFFTCETSASRLVELEYSDCARFESISLQPVYHPRYGPLELAKLAHGRVLFGEESQWREWVDDLLQVALENGNLYWMLYALGMDLRGSRDQAFRRRFVLALRSLLHCSDEERFAEPLELLADFERAGIQSWLRAALDKQFPCWRDDLQHGRRLYAYQVPEVWTAMRSLVHAKHS